MKIPMLLIFALFLFCASDLSISLFILVALFCGVWYYFHENREVYRSGLARQATDAMCNASEKFHELLDAEGIDSSATQCALRELIKAQIDMRDTHPNIDCETSAASLIKLVKK